MTLSLTLYSVAVSMPLTKVISPSSNAIERFKWTKCCVWLKISFLYTYECLTKILWWSRAYLSAISTTIVNKRQAIDIAHPM